MEPTVINATDLRIKTREIMERVKFKGECFLIQTFGQPTAVIISVERYKEITGKTLAQLEHPLEGLGATERKDTGKA
jgi:prevent-host-death family protein